MFFNLFPTYIKNVAVANLIDFLKLWKSFVK